MEYKIKESEVIKYYAEKLIPTLISETARAGHINPQIILSKFGLPTAILIKIRDYLIASGILETTL